MLKQLENKGMEGKKEQWCKSKSGKHIFTSSQLRKNILKDSERMLKAWGCGPWLRNFRGEMFICENISSFSLWRAGELSQSSKR